MNDIESGIPEEFYLLGRLLAYLSNDFAAGFAADSIEVFNESISPAPHIDDWLKFYEESNHLSDQINSTLYSQLQENKEFQGVIAYLVGELSSRFNQEPRELGNQIGDIFPSYQGVIDFALNLKKTGDIENFLTPTVTNKFYKLINNSPILFLFKVIIPCWILYGQSPQILYTDALSGNIDSISKLLKIDKSIIGNKKIANTIFKLSFYSKYYKEFNKIGNSFNSTVIKRQKKNIKVKLAGLIHILFHANGYEISFPQIQELFDKAYQSRHPEYLCDPDLPERPDSFAKAVKRANKFWAGLFAMDKN